MNPELKTAGDAAVNPQHQHAECFSRVQLDDAFEQGRRKGRFEVDATVAAERESCAKLVEQMASDAFGDIEGADYEEVRQLEGIKTACETLAGRIRARSIAAPVPPRDEPTPTQATAPTATDDAPQSNVVDSGGMTSKSQAPEILLPAMGARKLRGER